MPNFDSNWFSPKLVGQGRDLDQDQMLEDQMLDKDQSAIGVFPTPCSKVVCVGRNYAEHAKELNNPVPQTPLFFIKPNSSLCAIADELCVNSELGDHHYELELAILIGRQASRISAKNSRDHIAGFGLGLDLTLRELQAKLKAKGQPWEKAKAFDNSCPVTEFYPMSSAVEFNSVNFALAINEREVQYGALSEMLFGIETLIANASQHFTLIPGDILLTGTPAGVGKLAVGDQLTLQLNWQQSSMQRKVWNTKVIRRS